MTARDWNRKPYHRTPDAAAKREADRIIERERKAAKKKRKLAREDRLVLDAMPGNGTELQRRSRLPMGRVGGALSRLAAAGLAEKDGKTWRRVG